MEYKIVSDWEKENNYEPMVCLLTDEFPKWGNGVGLKYDKDKNKED